MAGQGLLSHSHLGRPNQTQHRPDTQKCCGPNAHPPHKMAASIKKTCEHLTQSGLQTWWARKRGKRLPATVDQDRSASNADDQRKFLIQAGLVPGPRLRTTAPGQTWTPSRSAGPEFGPGIKAAGVPEKDTPGP